MGDLAGWSGKQRRRLPSLGNSVCKQCRTTSGDSNSCAIQDGGLQAVDRRPRRRVGSDRQLQRRRTGWKCWRCLVCFVAWMISGSRSASVSRSPSRRPSLSAASAAAATNTMAVITTAIRLRFDCDSPALRPFDDRSTWRHDRAATLRRK